MSTVKLVDRGHPLNRACGIDATVAVESEPWKGRPGLHDEAERRLNTTIRPGKKLSR